jgi:prepilin-type N-terminal cleavage/methylation domain-containing protein
VRDKNTALRGFTLLELMIVVALIGILAAVVIPSWTSTARNKKYDPEISAMMTEISTREEQYKSELGNGSYLAATACPATPYPNGSDFNGGCVYATTPWYTMHVNPTDSAIRCTYAVTVGAAGTAPSGYAPCVAPVRALAGAWFWVLATCDMNADGGTNAKFCIASWDTKIQKDANYGK